MAEKNDKKMTKYKGKMKHVDIKGLRSIVCVKNVDDMKKVEQVEDCFILEFDPDQPSMLSNLSLSDNNSDDVSILAEKGKVACRDYPHSRHLCVIHPFKTTTHEIHCKMCYCYVCKNPAPCEKWTEGDPCLRHCDATDDCPTLRLEKTEQHDLIAQIMAVNRLNVS
ncbi:unnamed protein product [Amaranthus hypochondriacus]